MKVVANTSQNVTIRTDRGEVEVFEEKRPGGIAVHVKITEIPEEKTRLGMFEVGQDHDGDRVGLVTLWPR